MPTQQRRRCHHQPVPARRATAPQTPQSITTCLRAGLRVLRANQAWSTPAARSALTVTNIVLAFRVRELQHAAPV
jgi:hypothetical protein